jgi:DNA modification methylase
MRKEKIKIEHVDISLLKEAEYNPRKMTKKQEEDLTEGIKRYGIVDPLIANFNKERFNFLVGGHQRLKIAKKLGYEEVPVVYLNLTEEKEKELNLRLNRNLGEWDMDLLKEFDIDLLLDVGFDDADLSHIWDENLETEDDNFDEEKELEEIKKTDIKPGDLFALGKHLLLCGDSTQEDAVKMMMGKEKVDMIYSDPIYNIGVDYDKGIGGKKNYGGNINDNKKEEDYREFLRQTLSNGLSVCKKDAHIFYYSDQKYIGILQALYKELGIDNKRICLWIKNGINPTPQVAFNKCFEPVTYGTIGNPYLSPIKNLSEILNKEIDIGNRTIDDILDMLDIWLVKRLPGQEYTHSTEKPITLHEKPLRRCTKVNDIVLDLFAGSGSTLMACEQLKRRCYTIEINPIFCQLVINRFEKLTGTKVKLITNTKNICKK